MPYFGRLIEAVVCKDEPNNIDGQAQYNLRKVMRNL